MNDVQADRLGIIQRDFIASDAFALFSYMMTRTQKGKIDYEAKAREAYAAAEAFYKVGIINGHVKHTPAGR